MTKVVERRRERPAAAAAAGLDVTGFCSLVLALLFLMVCTVPGSALADGNELTQRDIVKRAMEERPSDPWPRGSGHVVLGIPGSQQPSKSYHEPGGSFSPAVGSFGVSIWVTDPSGAVLATSDSIPLDAICQRLVWPDPKGIPAVLTETPYYRAQWSCSGPGHWTLDLEAPSYSHASVAVVIRSVGPAGGTVELLEWSGQRLLVNNRWSVTVQPKPAAVHLAHEGTKSWTTARPKRSEWSGDDGWGCARLELGKGSEWKVVVQDSSPDTTGILDFPGTRGRFEFDVPDDRFVDCLHSQVAHLMMGLMDRRTPPGEPTNYPLAWQRDGAYVAVALARAAQGEVAKELASYFAENDFFGGFGSEADAPGLGIWAVTETAALLRQPEFDRWSWPHVRRKAELILKMLSADEPIERPYVGPVVPRHRKRGDNTLVCDPARNGLIVGRMDHHRPLLYVNAVSYLGLVEAAELADRLGEAGDAERWRSGGEQLRRAWLAAFKPPEWNNERTNICGLWPSWVAAPKKEAYRDRLWSLSGPDEAPRGIRGTPLWTYFMVAQAHQWLLLGGLNHVWKDLTWFWEHQASPGLYTWWEGSGEENTFHLWEGVRGWVNPPHVTPHYWTAAEMLLLQMDMLTYVDGSGAEPVLMIGGGVPEAWLHEPMSVWRQPTRLGVVDWACKDGTMHVLVRGAPCEVRLGPAFDADTPIHVEFGSVEWSSRGTESVNDPGEERLRIGNEI